MFKQPNSISSKSCDKFDGLSSVLFVVIRFIYVAEDSSDGWNKIQ